MRSISCFAPNTLAGRALVAGAAIAAGAAASYQLTVSADGAPTAQPLWYAGSVTDAAGMPLEGNHRLWLRLFPAPSGASAECSTGPLDAAFTDGRFRVELDAKCVEVMRKKPDLFLEVSVDDDSKPFPRTKVGAVPYALEASHALTADSAAELSGAQGAALSAAAAKGTALDTRLGTSEKVLTEVNTAMAAGGAALQLGYAQRTSCTKVASTTTQGAFHFDCTCEPGEVAISAGANAGATGNFLIESRRLSSVDMYITAGTDPARMWRIACGNTSGRVDCLNLSVTCLRVAH
jgi:hypothetical protein